MIKNKKLKKLLRSPKQFAVDALAKRSKTSTFARKSKKLIEDPTLYVIDYIKKRPKLQEKLEVQSDKIPSAKYHYNLYKNYKKQNFHAKAEEELRLSIQIKKNPSYLYELGMRLKQKKQWWQAVDAFKEATSLSTTIQTAWYKEYALALTHMNRHHEASTAWKVALSKGSKHANDWFLYGYTLELASKKNESNEGYTKAIEFDKALNAKELGIGTFHEKRGHWIPASKAYKLSSAKDPLNTAILYKLALSLDRCYNWEESEKVYLQAIALSPENIDWHYRLGFVRERQEKYEEAADAYRHAVENRKTHTPYWYYRLGYVLNKANKHEESCKAFLMMKKIVLPQADLVVQPSTPDTYTLSEIPDLMSFLLDENTTKLDVLGLLKKEFIDTPDYENLSKLLFNDATYKLKIYEYITKRNKDTQEKLRKEEEKLRKEEEKLLAEVSIIKNALALDSTRDDLWYKLAKSHERLGAYEKSANAYSHLIARKENFDGNLYFSLGHMLMLNHKYTEASKMFVEQRILQEANGINEKTFNDNTSLKKIMSYTYYYERFTLENNTILYESYHGRSISCNPYAIFKSLVEDERFKDYKHIWVINDKNKIPEELKSNENIIFIKRDCDMYMRYLAKTKYLINNSTFPDYYIRKDDQEYLNTWHGTPIKYMGKDIKNDFMSHKNVTKNFLQASFLIQPNTHTTDILLTRHDVEETYTGIIAEIGYPRQDLMLNISENEKLKIIKTLKLNKQQKTVLYAPTWRGTFGDADFDTTQLQKDIQKIQKVKNIQILFRGHYAAEKAFITLNSDITVVPDSIDTNTLLSVVDILITDYSSICFDFMALSRPIIYYVYDKKEYETERGLYFPMEELGGTICTNIHALQKALIQTVDNNNISETQKKSQEKFCPHDDGQATKRIVDLMFFNQKKDIQLIVYKEKKSILLYGGDFNPNGINTSFINLLNHIDTSKYSVSIAIDPNAVKNAKNRLEQFSRLHKDIKVIGRVGRMTMTLEEQWIKNKFDSQKTLPSEEQKNIYRTLFQREFKRMFGYGKFDYIVEFNGYGVFWPSLFAYQKNNAVYQHNDMYGEWTLKFPPLENLFKLYPSFNTLVSVSEQTMQHNMNNLCVPFKLRTNSFVYCDNVQNPEDALQKSKEALEDKEDNYIFKNTKVFINIARLSPEKDQEKLIRAFKHVSKLHPDARLVNLGSGPLEHHLNHLIKELKLEKKVFFLGQRSNPYPYLQKSDCFVLSSNHEGQPMTLFEALILEKPIIATDIVGNRSVLEGRPGHLVKNSEEGLTQGMLDFLESKYTNDQIFNYAAYNQDALNMFYEKVIGNVSNAKS